MKSLTRAVYFLPLLSALLMALSYIPFPPYALFFCYVPLWLFALRQKSVWSILKGAWLCQFFGVLLGFHWLAYTFREFGFFSWPVSILGLLGFASFANLHIPIALWLWFVSKKLMHKLCPTRSTTPFLFLLPLYSALSMEYYPMIFKWHWGYSWFYAGWPALQTAELWGFKFLNTLTLFFNLLSLSGYLLWTLPNKKAKTLKNHKLADHKLADHRIKALWVLGGGLILFILLNIQGIYLKHRWPEPDKTAKVLIIQPNIENLHWKFKKTKKDPRALALNQLIEETTPFFKEDTAQSASRPDFVLWPEGAYPYTIRHNGRGHRALFLSHKAKEWQTSILLSANGKSPKGITNSLFAFDPKGQLIQPPYDKTLLLVFGEYLPGEKWLNWSQWLSYYGRSFKRGQGEHKTISIKPTGFLQSATLDSVSTSRAVDKKLKIANNPSINTYRLGFQICYESLFDFFTRELAQEKAHILVNVTNDSWYGRGLEPYQHLYMTLARAIEVRRPLVRGTNTGFSAVISAKGQVLQKSKLYKKDSWIQEVPYHSGNKPTLFTSWGYYINTYVLCLLLGGFLACRLVFSRNRP